MSIDQRMQGHKRRKVLFIVSLLSIGILYVVAEFVSNKPYDSYNENNYISQFLLSPKNKEVATVEFSEASNSSYSIHEHSNFDKTQPSSNIQKPSITITVLQSEDINTTFKVVYPKLARKLTNRNVFVEMKDINKSSENIFFIETRCATEKMAAHFKDNKGLVLNARQCCAIESTARMNLDHNVYLFHSCSLEDDFFKHSPKFVEKLFKYPNIFVVRLNTTEVFFNSPLEDLHRRKVLETSNYPIEHTSDLMRLILLWRFGGVYSDLDVVTIRSLNNLKTNWAGMQDDETIANGVLNFEHEGEGHEMLQKALEYANTHYNPSEWSSNPMDHCSSLPSSCKSVE